MEQIEQLIEDYQRRLKTVMTEIQKGGNDLTINRLSTKGSCYRTFIVELERAKASLKLHNGKCMKLKIMEVEKFQITDKEGNEVLADVSGSLFDFVQECDRMKNQKYTHDYIDLTAEFGTLVHSSLLSIKEKGHTDWDVEFELAVNIFTEAFKKKNRFIDDKTILSMAYDYQKHIASLAEQLRDKLKPTILA